MHSTLIDFKKPIATIPSLAIHLDRTANSERHINAQLHLPPLLRPNPSAEELSMNDLLQAHIETRDELNNINVLNFDLSFYDHQAPQLIGLDESLLASARLDNLLSCFCASEAIINNDAHPALVVFTDHEEVGSQSQCGAQEAFG
jgi:Aspartyl aminopeptidase